MPALPRFLQSLRELEQRERARIVAEVVQVRGLMPLLMKPRHGKKWSQADRTQLRLHLIRVAAVSPYLFAVLLPAAPLTLPLLAWWLDRRRLPRRGGEPLSGASSEEETSKPLR
jgi:hypothetical protein